MKYYLYRDGTSIKVAHIDQGGALLLHKQGFELGPHPYDTKQQAEDAKKQWEENLRKLKLA